MTDPDLVTIYHNPRCSKSRAALQLLQEKNINLRVIPYLEQPPDVRTLTRLCRMLGGGARSMLRSSEAEYRELGLDDPSLDDATLLRQIAAHPRLLQRPIAVRGERAVIGRPPERVRELLP